MMKNNLDDLSLLFLNDILLRLSLETYKFNKNHLNYCLQYFKNNGIYYINKIHRVDIIDFLEFQKNKGLKNTTIDKRLNVLKRFIQFCFSSKLISFKVFNNIGISSISSLPKQYEFIGILNDNQLMLLFSYINSLKNDYPSLKKKIILLLFVSTGLRRSELCYIERLNYDPFKSRIYLSSMHTKTKKGRYIFLSFELNNLINFYLSKSESKYLFYDNASNHISPNYITKFFQRLSVTLNFRITPHMLRHTFATNLLKKGIDLETLRILMGHSSINTTQIYLHLNVDFLQETFNKFSNY